MVQRIDNISERQRLLRLIDGDPTAVPARRSFHGLAGLLARVLVLIREKFSQARLLVSRPFSGGQVPASLKALPSISAVTVLVYAVTLVVLADFVWGLVSTRQQMKAEEAAAAAGAPWSGPAQLRPLEGYMDHIRGKDIFNVHRIQPAADQGDLPKVDGLKFVGADWTDPPTAMIEDMQNAKTYFVKKGDFLKDLTVVEIYKDRVIIGYKDQLFELK